MTAADYRRATHELRHTRVVMLAHRRGFDTRSLGWRELLAFEVSLWAQDMLDGYSAAMRELRDIIRQYTNK